MLKHIHISELKPGMHVADPGIDWKTRPYLYIADQFVATEDQVRDIVGQGFQETYIDLDRSILAPSSPALSKNKAFGTGTAAVVSPVNMIAYKEDKVAIGDGGIGAITQKLYDTLTGIQYGRIADPFGWITSL